MRRLQLTLAVSLLAGALATFATADAGAQEQTGSGSAATQRALPSNSEILAIIRLRVDDKRRAGMVVGVIEPDGRKRIVAYGSSGKGQRALDANTVFEIGSISKVFTATLLSEMAQEGTLRLDDPVRRWLPQTVTLPTRNGKEITLANLSEQNSGLPRLPDNLKPADLSNPYAEYSVQQMYEFLSRYQLTRDPGARFEYSNLGVGLLGHALALSAGKSYEQLARERVWAPLGMTHTAISLDSWMKVHLALGHDDQGQVVSNWDVPAAFAGAGAIRSNMNDMLTFLEANLHAERGPLEKAMALAQVERANAGFERIGLNWFILHVGSDTIVSHGGGTGGYRSFIGFEPSRKVGVVVLSNVTGPADVGNIGQRLLLASKPTP